MNQRRSCWITHSEGGFVIDVGLVAGEVCLSPDKFWQEMKRGIVYSVERGKGEGMPDAHGSPSAIAPTRGR
jgi:hypothetical protein